MYQKLDIIQNGQKRQVGDSKSFFSQVCKNFGQIDAIVEIGVRPQGYGLRVNVTLKKAQERSSRK